MCELFVKRFAMNCAILSAMLIGGILNILSFCIPHTALLAINIILLAATVIALIASVVYYGYLRTVTIIDPVVDERKAEAKDFARSNIVTLLLCSIAAILFTLASI